MANVMTCDDAETALAAHAMGQLDNDRVADLQGHVESCANCRRAGREYMTSAHLLAVALEPEVPPARLRTAVLAAVYGDAAGARRSVARRRSFAASLWGRLPSGRPWTLVGGLATVAAVVLLVSRPGAAVPGPQRDPVAAVTVQLPGTAAMPSASGTLHFDKASGMAVVAVSGLPSSSTSPGATAAVYEVWLRRQDASASAMAYLQLQPDGSTWSAAVAMPQGMAGYTTITTTLEPRRGESAPTGPALVSGVVPANS